jgi:hypothetical protein
MSKLGIHVASSKRNGFGQLLSAGVACVVSIDQNIMAEVREKAPKAVIAFRTQQSPIGEDNPPGLIDAPLAQVPAIADAWMDSLLPIWARNPGADYYLVNNELDVSTLHSAQALNAFYLRCMVRAEAHDLRLGIGSFSTGCPSDDAGLTLEQRWEPLLPAVEHAAIFGHVMVLHAHALGANLMDVAEDIAFRHERSLAYFAQHGLNSKVLLGEISNGTGGVQPSLDTFMVNVGWWDVRAMNSPWRKQVIGAALYGFNAGETLTPAVGELVDWIQTHPDPIAPPPPPIEPRQYDRVYHLLPQSMAYTDRLKIDFEADPLKQTVGYSIDDAFITHPALRSRVVVVWNVDQFSEFHGDRRELEAWVLAHYAPLPEIIYRTLS